MKRRATAARQQRFVLWALLGIAAFGCFPAILRYEQRRFLALEPFFISPVTTVRNSVAMRNDSNASGHFGASRGGGRRKHQGIDLISAPDSPIYAARSGRVIFAGVKGGYGNFIAVLHPNGYRTAYAHLNALAVAEGDWVERGQVIGTSGRTGNADGADIVPHLHFEIRNPQQKPLDPAVGQFDPSLRIRR